MDANQASSGLSEEAKNYGDWIQRSVNLIDLHVKTSNKKYKFTAEHHKQLLIYLLRSPIQFKSHVCMAGEFCLDFN